MEAWQDEHLPCLTKCGQLANETLLERWFPSVELSVLIERDSRATDPAYSLHRWWARGRGSHALKRRLRPIGALTSRGFESCSPQDGLGWSRGPTASAAARRVPRKPCVPS